DYNTSFEALQSLGVNAETLSPLKSLSTQDLTGLTSILSGSRPIGEGKRQLPWFWRAKDQDQVVNNADDDEEINEGIRVEWFRGRERYRRWREEVLWLRREIASTLFDYKHQSDEWSARASSDYATQNPGYHAYCIRQADTYHGLLADGFRRSQDALTASPPMAICTRAIKSLSSACKM
ncbi:hypothetical protein FRC11_005876, partial [Ceratobasidium sp. 423]